MKILITGGAGFVGSHLCRRLLSEGHSVQCLDNLYTGTRKNIDDLFENPNFTFIEHDIRDYYSGEAVDQIYNLACPASPTHYQKDPLYTLNTSILGAIHMLNFAQETGATILQASTSEVYGDPTISPQHESYWGNVNPIGIRACYDEGKRCAETFFMEYYRKYGVNIRIIRIFNTYGPAMSSSDGRVVSNFIVQALRGEDITIYGDGSQTRSFQYIDDLLDAMVLMMNNTSGFIGPVNTGTDYEFSISELAHKILELLPDSSSKIVFLDLPEDDPKQRKADNRLAFEKLGWKPSVGLESGLQKTIEYFKKNLNLK